VREGELVRSGQVLVRMDTATVQAELTRAQASVRQAEQARTTARALVGQRQQAIQTATAVVRQREADLALAQRQWERTQDLVGQGFLPPQKRDAAQAQLQGARAARAVSQSLVAEARTGLSAAEAQITEAEAAIQTAQAGVNRVETDLADADLKAPRAGRVQVRAAQPGEVVGAGGRVLSIVDLSDVHMSFFLPEAAAGRLAIGAPARIVLDAAPQYVIPATISFVASVAQFTPKTVETSSERQKMVFKVRAQVSPELLQRYRQHVKTGLPGMAYVLVDPAQPWPTRLEVALPPVPQSTTQP
jgi:HlyD family secretion protein